MRSLVIGRFQPPHNGHKALIQSILDEGKEVCIAIRDTSISKDNPFTIQHRKRLLRKMFPDKNRVKIIKIFDIDEVCYGRKVGWGIREIKLDKEIESISATEIRNESLFNKSA